MKRSIFKPKPIPFQEYLSDTLLEAKRIVEVASGKQRYTSAQFEIALISFADLETLKKEMDPKIKVDFSEAKLECDWLAGFDWLDLAVNYGDKDAIAYFKKRLKESGFYEAYKLYKDECRPDCALQSYESSSIKLTLII
ncbi:hypothetical protein [Legionella cardiaca]|uniref:Ankyrin repeat protein n=1 Tax=Legionella cardiaca TaxID=1071983 RepID=A0ABY8ATI9_9GAMM|nr:hypothetical protein [Legionella cardiaca]WED43096.1 hypothetical protein PXX05_14535 [Legionella cardiaca]